MEAVARSNYEEARGKALTLFADSDAVYLRALQTSEIAGIASQSCEVMKHCNKSS